MFHSKGCRMQEQMETTISSCSEAGEELVAGNHWHLNTNHLHLLYWLRRQLEGEKVYFGSQLQSKVTWSWWEQSGLSPWWLGRREQESQRETGRDGVGERERERERGRERKRERENEREYERERDKERESGRE
jgi:hypothetical protein